MRHDWISLLDWVDPILLFGLIGSIILSGLISLISWFDLITLTWLLLPSPPHRKWWKALPITFRIIWFVRPRPHAKYTRTVYPYIPNIFSYSNRRWKHKRGLVKTWVSIILSISCMGVIVICIYFVVWGVTLPLFPYPFASIISSILGVHSLKQYNLLPLPFLFLASQIYLIIDIFHP